MLQNIFRNSQDKKLALQIKGLLSVKPNLIGLYRQAITHKSFSNSKSAVHNERLEFLGDAIINAVIADYLFKKYPYQTEGFLTELRSKIVSRKQINILAKKMNLHKIILLSKGTNITNDILGNAFEALIGALYLDKGYKTTYKVIVKYLVNINIDINELENTEINFKSRLLEWGQRHKKNISFSVEEIDEKGKQKYYKVDLLIDGSLKVSTEHVSKKRAEQIVAEKYYIEQLSPKV